MAQQLRGYTMTITMLQPIKHMNTFRMVTIVGSMQNIYKAFLYIGKKLETVCHCYMMTFFVTMVLLD